MVPNILANGWLQTNALDWIHWWSKTVLAKTKVNPSWPSSPRPPN